MERPMLQKISVKSLATVLLIILLVITLAYYIFPGYDSFFMLVGGIVGAGPFIIVATIVAIGIIISISKLVIRCIKAIIRYIRKQ